MPSPKTIVVAASVVVAVGIAAYAVSVVGGDHELQVLDGLLSEAEPAAPSTDEEELRRERMALMARRLTQPRTHSIFDGADEPAPQLDAAAEVNPHDARASFAYVMRHIERIGRKRQRLTQDQWQETWRTANDSYAALSIQLDGGDLAELEEAHRRLKKALRRVKVRGGKFRTN